MQYDPSGSWFQLPEKLPQNITDDQFEAVSNWLIDYAVNKHSIVSYLNMTSKVKNFERLQTMLCLPLLISI